MGKSAVTISGKGLVDAMTAECESALKGTAQP